MSYQGLLVTSVYMNPCLTPILYSAFNTEHSCFYLLVLTHVSTQLQIILSIQTQCSLQFVLEWSRKFVQRMTTVCFWQCRVSMSLPFLEVLCYPMPTLMVPRFLVQILFKSSFSQGTSEYILILYCPGTLFMNRIKNQKRFFWKLNFEDCHSTEKIQKLECWSVQKL